MALTLIDADQVARLLPMANCIQAVREAMVATSLGKVAYPLRSSIPVGDGQSMLFMPGSSKELGFYGAKLITLHKDNTARGLPSIQGLICLFDYDTGEPLAIVDGACVTGLRTAAASGLATDLLARRDARSLGIYGCGVQATRHIDAITAVRSVQEVVIWARNPVSADNFARKESERTGLPVRAVSYPAEAGACDILCTVTASPEPILLGEWVGPGTHINLVGSHSLSTREADSELIRKSRVYVDSLQSTAAEGGNIMIPVGEGLINETHIIGEIGLAANGDIPLRENREQITVYSSLGITSQDLFTAVSVYKRWQQLG